MSEARIGELRLVGVHDDGEHLVLDSADGTRFLLAIDQNLRTSISKARRVLPKRNLSGDGVYGPRDIQERFRQGATVEEVVEESGWDADRVRRYEWPIVAERAHIITAARNVMISPARRGEETAQSLDDHVARIAEKYGFNESATDWNTFQQESGSWTISVDFMLADDVKASLPHSVIFPARWSYNPANQSLYASNESAYFLMGKDEDLTDTPIPGIAVHENEEKSSPAPAQVTSSPLGARTASSSPVKSEPASSERPSATRGMATVRERKLADLLERARSSTPHAPVSNPQDIQGSQSSVSGHHFETAHVTVDTPVDSSAPSHGRQFAASSADGSESSAQPHHATVSPASEDTHSETHGAEEEQAPSPKPTRSKRTSVPSWDDIIFGNQRK